MKKGTTVHRQLELEVHDFVPVNIQTREDGWGLRIWNVIQGLRTLRATGMTRELDIWGVVDGEVVSGIIDEISYTCTDPELEAAMKESENDSKSALPDNQKSITEFFSSPLRSAQTPRKKRDIKTVYITDTKTRTSNTLPSGASLRPTKLQLMLYRHLLTLLCTDQVPADRIFTRYGLNRQIRFSDSFIAAIADLEFNFVPGFPSSPEDDDDPFADNSTTFAELIEHPTLEALWNLMIREYRRTLFPERLSPILSASFRSQRDGAVLGTKTFVYDEGELQKHVATELAWWRGERPPRGVDVEEAFKCRICEFAENCYWRIEKEKEIRAKFGKSGKAARMKDV
jgi:exonuclease V